MEAFAVSLSTIAVAEIGDRTQLLSLLLAARYRRPIPIIAGILIATLANHAVAASIGVWVGNILRPKLLDILVGASMLGMALWTLKPDSLDGDATRIGAAGAFVATLTSFFLAEIGDKTQIATMALGAHTRPWCPWLPARRWVCWRRTRPWSFSADPLQSGCTWKRSVMPHRRSS